jgi:hypothetical protein
MIRREILSNPFLEDVVGELHQTEWEQPIIEDAAEAVELIRDEANGLEMALTPVDARKALVSIAALAWRAAYDIGVEKRP